MSKKTEKAPQIPHFANKIDGWCNFRDFYCEIAEWIPDGGKWVEVGVYWGQSFGYAVVECLNRGKKIDMVAVDIFAWPHNGQSMIDKFHSEMQPVAGHYRAIQSASWDAADQFEDQSVDFVFIDADHIYEHVKKDILAWLPKIKPGGIIAGHDYNPPHEVERAVNEIFGDRVIPIPSDDNDGTPNTPDFFSWKVQL